MRCMHIPQGEVEVDSGEASDSWHDADEEDDEEEVGAEGAD